MFYHHDVEAGEHLAFHTLQWGRTTNHARSCWYLTVPLGWWAWRRLVYCTTHLDLPTHAWFQLHLLWLQGQPPRTIWIRQ